MIQLSPHVKELQEFFATHRLRFGVPEDVPPFTEALMATGAFHDEMTSMVRSIFLRHGGNVPRADLLQLVMFAVGGPQIDDCAEQYLPSIQVIVAFLGEVHRTRWGVIPTELAAAEASGTFAQEAPPASPPPPPDGRGFPVAGVAQPQPVAGPPEAVLAEALPARRSPEIFFRSHMMRVAPEGATEAEDPAPTVPVRAASLDASAAPVVSPEPAAPPLVVPDRSARRALAEVIAPPAVPAPLATASVKVARAEPLPAAPLMTDSASTTEADTLAVAPRKIGKVFWISLAILLLVVAIGSVMSYDRYLENKNWSTPHLAPAARQQSPGTSEGNPASTRTSPVLNSPAHVRVKRKPSIVAEYPLPAAVDPPAPPTTGLEPVIVPNEAVPVDPQAKPPAPIYRATPPVTTPVRPSPNPSPNPEDNL